MNEWTLSGGSWHAWITDKSYKMTIDGIMKRWGKRREKREKKEKPLGAREWNPPAVTWLALSMLRAGVHGLGLRQRALTLIAKKPNAVLNKLYKKFSRKHYNPQLCSFEVFLVYSIMQSLWEQSIHESKHGFHLVKTRQYKIRKKVY